MQNQKVVLYKNKFEVQLINETIWLSLIQMAELFGRDKSVISRHLRNIFNNKELCRSSVVAKNATTASDGKTYNVEFYKLDAILSVGYRVNSSQATQLGDVVKIDSLFTEAKGLAQAHLLH